MRDVGAPSREVYLKALKKEVLQSQCIPCDEIAGRGLAMGLDGQLPQVYIAITAQMPGLAEHSETVRVGDPYILERLRDGGSISKTFGLQRATVNVGFDSGRACIFRGSLRSLDLVG
jgi:hypothetical protein